MPGYQFRFVFALLLLLNSLCCAVQPQPAYGQTPTEGSTQLMMPALVLNPSTAPFPFFDDFEASTLDADWSSNSWGMGRVERSSDSPYRGTSGLFLGQKLTGNSGADLELTIDLSNQTEVFLDFWWRATGEAYEGTNGVYISDNDGATWKQVEGLSGNSQVYGHAIINITGAAAANGLLLNSHFKIRIYYVDYYDRIGGLYIDDIRVTNRTQVVATFPYQENFESLTVQQGLYPQSWGVGLTELGTEDPHDGSQQIFIGQKRGGNGGAALDLVIDLANQTDVYLDFWWRATGQAYEGTNGVYISDNDGISWKKIGELNGNGQVYGHPIFNLSAAAAATGLTFNNRFKVRLYYEDYYDRIGGLRIDDLRITNRPQIVGSFPLQENFEFQTVQQGLYPQNWGAGRAESSDEGAYSGAHHLFIGQNVTGNGGAYLDIMIDLSNQTDVFLDFWWRATGEAYEGTNGVYISDDEGTNWKKISNLNGNPQSYNHLISNVSAAAADHGLTLNNRFKIRIYYADYYDRIGGLRIDDLRIGTEDPRRIGRTLIYLPLVRK